MRAVLLALLVLTPAPATAPAQAAVLDAAPRNLSVSILGGTVHLTWVPPDLASGNTQVKLLRRLNEPPTGPADPAAEVLTSGPEAQSQHPIAALLPDVAGSPRVYHYAVFGCDASGTTCETVGSRASLAPSLETCLRGGGYTIFWRHADANVCGDRTELGPADSTSVPNWWRSCDTNCPTATARQLNADGVQHAIFIGQQFRFMGIPVGRVISSEFCRCTQTAESMDFGPTIETDPGITLFVHDEANRCAHCFNRVEEVPAAGTNTAIIGHSGFPQSCVTMGGLQWSECAIFRPDGAGNATLITQVVWSDWGTMATDVARTGDPVATLDAPIEVADGVRIRYHLASSTAERVGLAIFDVRGRRLWSAQWAAQGPGAYEHIWNRHDATGHPVARGVYLVRLQAGPTPLGRKALVLGR